MKLTLLVENNPKIESFYKLNLFTWLGLETTCVKSGPIALEHLSSQADTVNLIIVRCRIGKEDAAKMVIDFLKLKNIDIPVIVIGPGEVPNVNCVANSLDLKLLIKKAAVALNITAKDMSNKVVADYFPIPIAYFHSIKRSVCPVYIQDPEMPQLHNLKIEKLKDFDTNLIKELIQEGISFLYVDKMDRLDFVNNVTSELISDLQADEISEDELVTAVDKSIELLSTKLLNVGITEETIALSRKNMAIIMANAKKSTKLSKLLDRLLSNKTSYLYKHTQILTYVGIHIVHNIDWGNADQEEKIGFIAFFHDIALENDMQCQISSMNELKRSTMSDAEKTLVEKHAQIAAEYVTKFPHAPMGSDQIIRQHHGQLNGLGFSDHYGTNISPMAMVFIVAEEFTKIILKQENGNMNREEMLRELREEFTTSRFLKIVDKLETLIL